MPREKGSEWKHVTVLCEKAQGLPKVKCTYCDKEFVGGLARIRGHLIGDRSAGIGKCSKVPPEVLTAVQQEAEEKDRDKINKRRLGKIDILNKSHKLKMKERKFSAQIAPEKVSIPSIVRIILLI